MLTTATMRYVAAALVLAFGQCFAQGVLSDWPSPDLPQGSAQVDVGEEIVANGVPMRIKTFVNPMPKGELIAWFRRSLGTPLMENEMGPRRILGRVQGNYYVTVQLESQPSARTAGTKGLVSVSHIQRMHENRQAYVAKMQRWMQRWPAGTQVVSHVESEDVGRKSRLAVMTNRHSVALNRDAVLAMMHDDGYVLHQEVTSADSGGGRVPAIPSGALALFFRREGNEAVVTIQKDAQGQSGVVLNTITQTVQRPH